MRKILYTNDTFKKWLASYLLILILPLVMMIVISLHAFSMVKNEVTQVYNGALRQLQSSLDAEFQSVQNMLYSISADNRIQSLAYTDTDFSAHQYQTMKQIQMDFQKFALTSPLIENIYLYFPSSNYMLGNQGQYNLERIKVHFDSNYGMAYLEYASIINSYHFQDLIPFTNVDTNENMIFLMHSVLPAGQEHGGRVLILMKLNCEMLQEQMALLNGSFESQMEMVLDGASYTDCPLPIPESEFYHIMESNERIQLNIENAIVLSVPSHVQNVHYMMMVNLDTLKRETDRSQFLFIACIFVSIVLGIGMAYIFSRRQYRPLEQLIHLIRGKQKTLDGQSDSDEYQFLAASFERILNEMQQTQGELTRREAEVRKIVLARLLIGRFSCLEQAAEPMQNAGIDFPGKEFIIVSFLVRDDSQLFFEDGGNVSQDDEISYIIVQNIAEELVNEQNRGYCTELDDQIVMIVCKNPDTEMADFECQVKEVCFELIRLTAAHFNLLLGCAVSAVHYDSMGIAAGYKEVSEIREYVYISDTDCNVITWTEFLGTDTVPVDDEVRLSERCAYFVSLVREGAYTQAMRNFDELIDMYMPSDLNNLALAKCRVFGVINQLIVAFEDLKEEFSDDFYNQLDPAGHLLQVKSVGALRVEVSRILNEITRHYVERNPIPPASKVEQIKDYIWEHFANPNLSAAMISEAFGMNGAYLSRFFKKQAGCGVLDYIHEIRIQQAKKLMAETNESIKSISEQVGYYNSLTFIRAFKRQEGCTPGQYRETLES